MSSCLSRWSKSFRWVDSYRVIHPHTQAFSRYYEVKGVAGASRIDRQYHWGDIKVLSADYRPIAFSDHLSLIIKVQVPTFMSKLLSPKSRPIFKIKEEVAQDLLFQEAIKKGMEEWATVKEYGLDVLQ